MAEGSQESNEEYLARHGLDVYIKDCWRLAVASNDPKPRNVIAIYFANVLNGSNVVGREYAYVWSTRRNRIYFLRHVFHTLWDAYRDTLVTVGDLTFLGTMSIDV